MTFELHHMDVMDFLGQYKGPLFHAVFDDPPYHLTIEKRFGKEGAAQAKDGVYNRSASGFMNLNWDGGYIAFNPELWIKKPRFSIRGDLYSPSVAPELLTGWQWRLKMEDLRWLTV